MSRTGNIIIKGAREHNLKNIDVIIPRDKLVVISGVSGSGKSSLAFDTIYAEGQRRYVESLSAYARQFLGLMEKPDLDYIEGLSPAISIEQKTTHKNPRSTVATITEIYDYFRLLYARIGTPYCYSCGKAIQSQTIDQIVSSIIKLPEGTKIMINAPVARKKKGEFQKVFEDARKSGFTRVKVDGEVRSLDEEIILEKQKKHTIDVVIDRISIKDEIRQRVSDSVETALKLTNGLVNIEHDGKTDVYSEHFSCTECSISYPEIQPRLFSFNNPEGACSKCHGLGEINEFDIAKIIPDDSKSIAQNGIATHLPKYKYVYGLMESVSQHFKINLNTSIKDLSKEHLDIILYGSDELIDFRYESKGKSGVWEYKKKFKGIINDLQRRYKESSSEGIQSWLESFMTKQVCSYCDGKRLNKIALSVKIDSTSIYELSSKSVQECFNFFETLHLDEIKLKIASQILKEIKARLRFLVDVGLSYLTLDRKAATLSGGEAQRIRLATQIGSKLVGVLYILDEPTIGLHQRDNDRLLRTLLELRDIGNTLIIVEHDEQIIRSADYIIELGPGAGVHGGEIISQGTPLQIEDDSRSITGAFLSGKNMIPVPNIRRVGNGKELKIKNAKLHNLKNISVTIPLAKLTVVTGVSGSGKSTLVHDVLLPELESFLKNKKNLNTFATVEGAEEIDKIINIDQSPIGRTPRSNPATYTGVFTYIRDLFSVLEGAKVRGYKPGRFSFNVKGGRCEQCKGDGQIKIEMHFLPDVYVTCENCSGKRYNKETLEVKYKGYSIADVLEMTVEKAITVFDKHPPIIRKLITLNEVGLGYMQLGQSALTLSGGEAQRIKLADELSKRQTGKTIYLLDEPTTGLHYADVKQLVNVLNSLVDSGNTMIIIEHNLDVIKIADYIIDLGPEGGKDGGYVVAVGTPDDIMNSEKSFTGYYLKELINQHENIM